MIVCICHNVSERAIRATLAEGARSMKEVRQRLNVGSGCGKCNSHAKTLVRACLEDIQINKVRREAVAV